MINLIAKEKSMLLESCGYDWSSMTKGQRFVALVYARAGKRITEYEFLRVNRNTLEPVFRDVNDGNTITKVRFLFFVAPGNEALLEAKIQKDIAEQLQREERWKIEAEQRRQESAKHRVEIDKKYQDEADKLGLSLDEFKDAMSRWSNMRRSLFRPNQCFMCSRLLTDHISIQKGIGPECITRVADSVRVAVSMNLLHTENWKRYRKAFIDKVKRAGLDDVLYMVEEAEAKTFGSTE